MNTTANWVTEPLKKKRGRPKKTENTVNKPKGKRGRPKKIKDDSIVLQQPAIKRKRGRPKKEKPTYDIDLLRKSSKSEDLTDYTKRAKELLVSMSNPKNREKYYDITTNKLVDLLNPPKNKKTYTYIIEAKVRVVED